MPAQAALSSPSARMLRPSRYADLRHGVIAREQQKVRAVAFRRHLVRVGRSPLGTHAHLAQPCTCVLIGGCDCTLSDVLVGLRFSYL